MQGGVPAPTGAARATAAKRRAGAPGRGLEGRRVVRIAEIAKHVVPHDFLGLPTITEDGQHVIPYAITGVTRPDIPAKFTTASRHSGSSSPG
jgi:hypothetical protein